MDVFIFQKLEEKSNRINDIWYRGDRGNVLDLESLDPGEVKFALITNLEELRTVDFAQLGGEGIEYFDRITGQLATETDYDEGKAYKAEWSIADWGHVSSNPNCFINEMKSFQVVVRWKEKGMDYSSAFFTFERGRKKGDIS
jgi:hypothetical protein